MTAPLLARGGVCPRCQSAMVAGTRYEADGTVDVTICWTCGAEFPPFGACCTRNPLPIFVPIPERDCEQCDAPLALRYANDPRRFCSPECVQASHIVVRVSVTCPCGAEFKVVPSLHQPNPTKGHRRGIYCSKSCAARFWERKRAS